MLYCNRYLISAILYCISSVCGRGGGVLPDFVFCFVYVSRPHAGLYRSFFGLATNTLNVRNKNNYIPVIYIVLKDTFNMPTSYTNNGCGKREAYQLVHGDAKAATRCWTYLEDYWPRAGGLSVVNAIGTQLRDPINYGLTR